MIPDIARGCAVGPVFLQNLGIRLYGRIHSPYDLRFIEGCLREIRKNPKGFAYHRRFTLALPCPTDHKRKSKTGAASVLSHRPAAGINYN